MNPFIEKYNHLVGTHCYFCDREYSKHKGLYIKCGSPLHRTKEHIVPKSKIIYNIHTNYIGSCYDCNSLKGRRDAKQFAGLIEGLIESKNKETFSMYHLLPIMKIRAWKLYNKTSNLHKNYSKVMFKYLWNNTIR